jgi:lysophospholipase L1-like esterase
VDGPLINFHNDVSSLQGVTDCLVLLGTNDLCSYDTATLEDRLALLYDKLRPYCRVWTATLTPREVENYGDLKAAQQELREVNTWLRGRGQEPLIDFSAVTRDPAHPDAWLPEYEADGVHPNYDGAWAMAHEAARVIQAANDAP